MDGDQVWIDRLSIFGIRTHACAQYPNECCGLMFGYRMEKETITIQECIPLDNEENDLDSGKYYRMSPMSVWLLEKTGRRKGMEPVGIYHSHPDEEARLSETDKAGMIPGQIYAVASVGNDGCREIRMWERASFDTEAVECRYTVKG